MATYISDIDITEPDGSTQYVYELDDSIRALSTKVFNSFGAVAGAVTATHTEINFLDGLTGLGTAAQEDIGTAVGDVVQLSSVGGSPGLPAVDGSQLTGISSLTDAPGDVPIMSLKGARSSILFHALLG